MGSGEKRIAALLTVALVVLIGVYIGFKPQPAAMPNGAGGSAMREGGRGMGSGPAGQAKAGSPGCSTSTPAGGKGGVPTQEFGKKGAKVEIVAALPITHGCHVNTEAQLKEAYKKFPGDVHLTIYDLFGADGQKFVSGHGGQRAVVFINGKTSFSLNGKDVKLERTEDLYNPNDIVPIVEQEVKKG